MKNVTIKIVYVAKYSLKSDILASDWIKQPVAKFLTLMILHT